MATARDQMRTIEAELERVRDQMSKLQVEEALLLKLRAQMLGQPMKEAAAPRKRAASVKPLVLDILHNAGSAGMTTGDVAVLVKERVPEVAKDTVGSVLSRLKSDGVLTYAGERYFEKGSEPAGIGFQSTLRSVN